jgi:CRISPR-associated exonuclease Cas4
MIPGGWIAAGAVLALLVGLMMIFGGRGIRRRHGWMAGKTIALDNVTLVSHRYRMIAKPDRLVRRGGTIIPEERKSAQVVRRWHRVQIGVTFLVIEDKFRVKPTHGFIITGDDVPHRIENDPELRALVLDLAGRIREARKSVGVPILVAPKPGQCRPCGMREHCGQARL